jgi:hypothetical protein
VGQPIRSEVAALLKRAQTQLRRAQELHADLKVLMARFDTLGRAGVINRRRSSRISR